MTHAPTAFAVVEPAVTDADLAALVDAGPSLRCVSYRPCVAGPDDLLPRCTAGHPSPREAP
jgi:hypothetical protein